MLVAEADCNGLVSEISPRWLGLIPLRRTSSKTPAPNFFLIGRNYARLCQDAKKTNRVIESRWEGDPAVLYVLAVYVCTRRPRAALGASQAVFMRVCEVESCLPRPGLAGPLGERSTHTSIHHAVARRLAPGTCSVLSGILRTLDLTDRQPFAGSRGAAGAVAF